MKGDVVVMPFPFSDLSSSKRRPALVIADALNADIILCQITSSMHLDIYSIPFSNDDLSKGRINIASMIRPNKLFTADASIILYKIGTLKKKKIKIVEEMLKKILFC